MQSLGKKRKVYHSLILNRETSIEDENASPRDENTRLKQENTRLKQELKKANKLAETRLEKIIGYNAAHIQDTIDKNTLRAQVDGLIDAVSELKK